LNDILFPKIKKQLATGNWGCGVFGGNVELKAVMH
jgi:hypothetical protein